MLTADTITDEQIESLYVAGKITSLTRTIAQGKMNGPRVGASAYEVRREREYCADVHNGRVSGAARPKRCPVCDDGACETKSKRCGK